MLDIVWVILLFLGAGSFFLRFIFLRKTAGNRYYSKLIKTNDFRKVNAEVEIFKIKGFENIINKEFLNWEDYFLKIKKGVIKSQHQDTFLLCDGIVEQEGKEEGSKKNNFSCSFLLHLYPSTNLEIPVKLKIRLNNTVLTKQPVIWWNDWNFIIQDKGDSPAIFSVSSDIKIEDGGMPENIRKKLLDFLKKQFPFNKAGYKGILILSPKGWLILSTKATDQGMYSSLREIDKKLHN